MLWYFFRSLLASFDFVFPSPFKAIYQKSAAAHFCSLQRKNISKAKSNMISSFPLHLKIYIKKDRGNLIALDFLCLFASWLSPHWLHQKIVFPEFRPATFFVPVSFLEANALCSSFPRRSFSSKKCFRLLSSGRLFYLWSHYKQA